MSSAEDIDSVVGEYGHGLGERASSMAASLYAEAGNRQDAAFFELTYGLVFLAVRQLSLGLDKRHIAPTEGRGLVEVFEAKLLATSLQQHFPSIDPSSPDIHEWVFQHRQAMWARRDAWLRMPVAPPDPDHLAGSFTWELPKQASQSAGVEGNSNLLERTLASAQLRTTFTSVINPVTDVLLDMWHGATSQP